MSRINLTTKDKPALGTRAIIASRPQPQQNTAFFIFEDNTAADSAPFEFIDAQLISLPSSTTSSRNNQYTEPEHVSPPTPPLSQNPSRSSNSASENTLVTGPDGASALDATESERQRNETAQAEYRTLEARASSMAERTSESHLEMIMHAAGEDHLLLPDAHGVERGQSDERAESMRERGRRKTWGSMWGWCQRRRETKERRRKVLSVIDLRIGLGDMMGF